MSIATHSHIEMYTRIQREAYMYTDTQTHMHSLAHTHKYTGANSHTAKLVNTQTQTYTGVYKYPRTYAHSYTQSRRRLHTHAQKTRIQIHKHICTFLHIDANRVTHREIDKCTDIETHTPADSGVHDRTERKKAFHVHRCRRIVLHIYTQAFSYAQEYTRTYRDTLPNTTILHTHAQINNRRQ